MADWETGFVIAELNTGRFFKKTSQRYQIKTVGLSLAPIVTMGGIRIQPELTCESCLTDGARMLILPGGETWLHPCHAPILLKAQEFLAGKLNVAAICGATIGLAKAGLLNSRYHTSNDLGYLQTSVPEYAGAPFYRQEPAVTDQRVTTASGMSPVQFACQIFEALGVFNPKTLNAWQQLLLTQKPCYYHDLMGSLQQESPHPCLSR